MDEGDVDLGVGGFAAACADRDGLFVLVDDLALYDGAVFELDGIRGEGEGAGTGQQQSQWFFMVFLP
ncbi:hypothetical protein [Hydrogenimonas sp.]